MPEPLLEMSGISKAFGGTPVLSAVDFSAWPGEVHALVGENGAGKSTLMKILNGVYPKDSGSIRIAGEEAHIRSPHDAARAGISMIFQEHTLADTLTVAENIYLGAEPRGSLGFLDNRRMNRDAAEVLRAHGFQLDAGAEVARLTRAQKQMVEIARAVSSASRVVVMDEPTAMLSRKESEELFRIIGGLTARGLAVVYISHRMEELERIAQRITILRNGACVYTGEYSSLNRGGIIRHMVGRDIHELFPTLDPPTNETVLEVRGLGDGRHYRDISFDLHRGEVLGFGGLVGAGRTDLVRGIFGVDPPAVGTIRLNGREVRFETPGEAIRAGMGLLTEDRKHTGVFPDLSLIHNISIAAIDRIERGPFLQLDEELRRCRELIASLHIRGRSERETVYRLSGGNQQKAIFARWLFTGSSVLILDEPTQGVDVGARTEIYSLIKSIAARGGAVLMISSDLPELLNMSHRIAVMRNGALVVTLDALQTDPEEIMRYAALERERE
jgi:ribose transport system ATP-binding protein